MMFLPCGVLCLTWRRRKLHRHPTVFVLTVVAAIIVANYAVDVLYASFPHNKPIAGFKQAVTGA